MLWLFLFAACASRNDGFVEQVRGCGPGEEIGVEAGWESSSVSSDQLGETRQVMLVRVSNNSDRERTVKFVRVDPLNLQRDGEWLMEGGARDGDKVIPEGEAATFDIDMMSRRRIDQRGLIAQRELDVAVTVVLDEEESIRCRFRVSLL